MKASSFFFAFLFLLVPMSSSAQPVPRCAETPWATFLPPIESGVSFTVPITAIANTSYYLAEIKEGYKAYEAGVFYSQPYPANKPVEMTLFSANDDREQYFWVTVTVARQGAENCRQDFEIQVRPSAALARNAKRIVIPVAGSSRGAFNSVFRTRVVLQNRWPERLTGKIVFHRAGSAGSPSDPVKPYDMAPYAFVAYEDVLAALQVDGLGSLDIVPDLSLTNENYKAPRVRADIISVNVSGGVYSASLPVVTSTSGYPGATLGTPEFFVEPASNKRVNVGVRSLSDPVRIEGALYAPDGTLRRVTTRAYAADFFEQTTIDSWFGDLQQPGDRIEFFIVPESESLSRTAGGAIVYLAETDNSTNDVSIITPSGSFPETVDQPAIAVLRPDGLPGPQQQRLLNVRG